MTNFIPTGTKIPSTSNYLKLKEGENTLRALSPAIIGWEYFNADKKPVRSKTEPVGMPEDIGYKDGKPNSIKYFWAFVVWNYQEERVQYRAFGRSS